jgi:hypothetical protein
MGDPHAKLRINSSYNRKTTIKKAETSMVMKIRTMAKHITKRMESVFRGVMAIMIRKKRRRTKVTAKKKNMGRKTPASIEKDLNFRINK